MVFVIISCKNIPSRSMLLVTLLSYGLHVVTCKDGAPPCFGIISSYTYHMIEPQYEILDKLCAQIVCENSLREQMLGSQNNLTTITVKAKRIHGNEEVLCLHLSIHLASVTDQNLDITGILEGRRLYRKYHAVLRHYIFPFTQFVPHTHWSPPPYNRFLLHDRGLVIDDRYYCKPDHINIVPWQHVTDMSEDMLIEYIIIMNQIIDHEFVRQHYRINHYDPLSFFVGHRNYIACVEQELSRHGVSMPYWSAETTIPPLLQGVKRSPIGCFSSVLCIEGWLDLPIYSTNISLPTAKYFHPERICQIETLAELHALVFDWHGSVHMTIGGSYTFYESAASLLFFPYHNYIDKFIYKYWEENC